MHSAQRTLKAYHRFSCLISTSRVFYQHIQRGHNVYIEDRVYGYFIYCDINVAFIQTITFNQ